MKPLKKYLILAALLYALLLIPGIATFPSSKTSSPVSKRSLLLRQLLTDEFQSNFSTPENRIAGPLISNSVIPYILMHTGCREADNNGAWKRHAVKDAFGTLHVLYPVFDNDTTTNNRHKYNCLAAGASTMTFPPGSEAQANPPQLDQNGAIDVRPSGKAVWVGRGFTGNSGTLVSFDSSSCAGLITSDTVSRDFYRPLDPAIYVVNETTWVAFLSNFNSSINNYYIGCSRTTDGGETWTPQVIITYSTFLNFAVTGKGNAIHVFSTWVVFDTTVFNDREEITYTKSTDGGISWTFLVNISGPFELPTYQPLYNGSLTSLMIGDTAHVFWLDRSPDSTALPGGHVHHMAVKPDGTLQGPHKVADINLFFDQTHDNSTTIFGLGFGIWQHPTCAYSKSTGILYALWSSPPEDPANPGLIADSTDPAAAGGRTFPCADIWCAASRNNGRSWDVKTNVTMTNHNGCNGTTIPCEHEFYISAAAEADSVIYVVAQVQKFPGFQSLGSSPDPGPSTRLNDEWRLYLVPARALGPCLDAEPPILTCSNSLTLPADSDRCGAIVNFSASASDDCSKPAIICTPANGSTFPIGTTPVVCIATDTSGKADTCNFDVTVTAIKGDLNRDGLLTASDVMRELNCVFLGITPPAGDCACDLNCDGAATAADVIFELTAVFLGTPFPCP